MSTQATRSIPTPKFSELLCNFDDFLFDCDGVIYLGNQAIPGVPEVLQKLVQAGKRVFYVTNNSSKSRTQIAAKLKKMNFPIDDTGSHIIGTANVTAWYLKHVRKIPETEKVYLMGMESMVEELNAVNISHFGSGPDTAIINTFDDQAMSQLKFDDKVTTVVVAYDGHLSFTKVLRAATYISRPGTFFIATNEDTQYPSTYDITVPGTGSIVNCVKTAANRDPDVVIGKPHSPMFQYFSIFHKANPSRSLMIGDNLHTDIAFGNANGIKTLLVLTGVVTKKGFQQLIQVSSDEAAEASKILPDYVLDAFTETFLKD